jgi:hypothetical protein
MTREEPPLDIAQDIFAEHAEWLAAEVRQLFRASRARDAKAIEVALFYLFDYVSKVLRRHLSEQEGAWDSSLQPLDFASHRWFDGISADPEYPAPGCLRLQGTICWVVGQEQWHYDPLDFQIELCPNTGSFKRYSFRFGDSRPLSAKIKGCETPGVPMGAWAYEFEKRSAEALYGLNSQGGTPRT